VANRLAAQGRAAEGRTADLAILTSENGTKMAEPCSLWAQQDDLDYLHVDIEQRCGHAASDEIPYEQEAWMAAVEDGGLLHWSVDPSDGVGAVFELVLRPLRVWVDHLDRVQH
jgi:hypothetical protein